MNNAQLIKALRYCGNFADRDGCDEECPYQTIHKTNGMCIDRMMIDATDALEAAEKRIAELEALIPKDGEWIIDGMNEYELSYGCIGYEPRYRCSKCGITTESYLRTERPIMPEDADFPNYCPNCGAIMKTVTECHTLEDGERKDGERKYDADYQLSVLMQEYFERYEPTYNSEDGSM